MPTQCMVPAVVVVVILGAGVVVVGAGVVVAAGVGARIAIAPFWNVVVAHGVLKKLHHVLRKYEMLWNPD